MKLRDAMTRCVEIVHPETTLTEAAVKMRSADVGPLPVHDGVSVVGIVTDRDITVRAIAMGFDPGKTRVGDIMTPGVYHCFDDQDVSDAARIMAEKLVRRLPVFDRSYRLVGIISLTDLAGCMECESTSTVLEEFAHSKDGMRGPFNELRQFQELQQWPPPAWW